MSGDHPEGKLRPAAREEIGQHLGRQRRAGGHHVVVDGDLEAEAVGDVDRHHGEDDPGEAQTANREDEERQREVQLPFQGERPVGAVQGVEGAREE